MGLSIFVNICNTFIYVISFFFSLPFGSQTITPTTNRLTADEKGASEAAKRASAKAETLGDELHSSEAAARAARDEANELKRRLKKESASSQVAGT